MKIKFKKLSIDAKTPFKKHEWDAGFDLTATSIKETDKYIQYGTDIAFEIPNGYVGFLVPRSSVTDKDLLLKNSIGVIDAPYRGEIKFRFYKNIMEEVEHQIFDDEGKSIGASHVTFAYNGGGEIYELGNRVGQIIFIKLPNIELIETTDELSETERGEGGYGSTNK